MLTPSFFRSVSSLLTLLAFIATPLFAQDENELAPVISPPPPARALATPSIAPSATPTSHMSPAASAPPTASPTPVQLTDVLFKNLKARAIGPAVMGGRVSDIAIDPRNPAVFFVGLATGGRL